MGNRNLFLRKWFVLLLCLVLFPNSIWAEEKTPQALDQREIYELLQQYYVDPSKVKRGTVEEMLNGLQDPYTQYFSKDEFQSFLAGVDGAFSGIGMYVEEKEDNTYVMSVIADSPAEKAGLQKGDRIIAVDGESVVGLPIEVITSRIKGKEGTEVLLGIMRGDQNLTFRIIRAKIQLPIVQYEILPERIGYIQILSFGEKTDTLVKEALDQFKTEGIKSLIIDVRGNPGGRLESVVKVANLFIAEGPILWVKDNKGILDTYDAVNGTWWDTPIHVLTDNFTASASEILTAALKDYQLATVVGTQTFGKGTVQVLVPLSSGNGLKLTVEEYFSPKLNKINLLGVSPHITITLPDEQLLFAQEMAKGIHELSFTETGEFIVNDQKIKSAKDIAVYDQGWYISLYRLQLLIGGELGWDHETRTASYAFGGDVQYFSLADENHKVIDNRIFIPLEKLSAFQQLQVISGEEGVTKIKIPQ